MASRDRVPEHTREEVNRRIEGQTRERVLYYASNPGCIDRRLRELDEEWDIERMLETNSAAVSLFGLAMGFAVNKRWFLLPLAVQSFFLQHALQGWCPPLPVLRRYGYRTSEEIERERTALKAVRGDFEKMIVTDGSIRAKVNAVWEVAAH